MVLVYSVTNKRFTLLRAITTSWPSFILWLSLIRVMGRGPLLTDSRWFSFEVGTSFRILSKVTDFPSQTLHSRTGPIPPAKSSRSGDEMVGVRGVITPNCGGWWWFFLFGFCLGWWRETPSSFDSTCILGLFLFFIVLGNGFRPRSRRTYLTWSS